MCIYKYLYTYAYGFIYICFIYVHICVYIYIYTYTHVWGFPGGASCKEPTCQFRRPKRLRFHPWVGKIPWKRAWQPTPGFLPGESQGQRSLVGYRPWGHRESGTTEQHAHTLKEMLLFLHSTRDLTKLSLAPGTLPCRDASVAWVGNMFHSHEDVFFSLRVLLFSHFGFFFFLRASLKNKK